MFPYLFIGKHLTHIKYSVEAAKGLSGLSVHCTSVRTWVQNPRTHRKLDPVVCVCKASAPAARWESVEAGRPVREDDKGWGLISGCLLTSIHVLWQACTCARTRAHTHSSKHTHRVQSHSMSWEYSSVVGLLPSCLNHCTPKGIQLLVVFNVEIE